ncbi:MAG: phage integrase SAM-like domain-containing protein [Haliscomenobacter sp.]|uniref:phage integrase SAM-like domain-containing protein n=1 Tax=Haliscomenobacter sp. TaxID=2717303 RepID=UPI0029B359E2|nr:phage integrase SAM-like domain-containing protein [Haliscomenobacter sp.]MDX2072467.1 phage integrase SAM-like domain-containing protein [Haliscomenobacter sp.]
MGEPNFRLQAYTSQDGKSPITLDFQWTVVSGVNIRLMYAAKASILRSHWNKKTQRPKNIIGYEREYALLTEHLDKMAQEVRVIYRKYQAERKLIELTRDRMRQELDQVFEVSRPIKVGTTFFAWSEDYLKSIFPKDSTYNESTGKILSTSLRHLKAFANDEDIDLDFQHFNRQLYGQFVNYLRNKKGLGDNTIEKIVFAGLKRFLNEATDAGVNFFTAYKDVTPKKVGVQKTKGDKIYLTRSELKQMYEYPLPLHLANVRDAFVCAVLLGLRYGDWHKVCNENLIDLGEGKKALSIVLDKKPQPRVVVPCHPAVMEILKKHNGVLPVISNQKTNQNLKEIGHAVGMIDQTSKTVRKGRVIETKHSKFELLTCHVSRNCFESEARRAQIPQRDIDLFTGHSSNAVSDIYDRRQLVTIAIDYRDHRFFNTWDE